MYGGGELKQYIGWEKVFTIDYNEFKSTRTISHYITKIQTYSNISNFTKLSYYVL